MAAYFGYVGRNGGPGKEADQAFKKGLQKKETSQSEVSGKGQES